MPAEDKKDERVLDEITASMDSFKRTSDDAPVRILGGVEGTIAAELDAPPAHTPQEYIQTEILGNPYLDEVNGFVMVGGVSTLNEDRTKLSVNVPYLAVRYELL